MQIEPGIQVLIDEKLGLLKGKRVGLITHPAAVLPDLTHILDALLARQVPIRALFGPEHGFYGEVADGVRLADRTDPRTGLPVYSLYGEHLAPPPEALQELDLLVFDIQDVGARFYTFISTLWHTMQAASAAGKKLIVCDRPNPIGGEQVEGPLVEDGFRSFVGIAPLPIRHGLTIGELARYFCDLERLDLDLEVVPMQGWRRRMWFDETGLPWVLPSTNMPHLSTAAVYPGNCLLEGVNLSEGRGTALPFELFGAPWLDAHRLADELNRRGIPGARFRPAFFQPTTSKYQGQNCRGAQIHVVDRSLFRPVRAGLEILQAARTLAPGDFTFLPRREGRDHPTFDLLAGSGRIRAALEEDIPAGQIAASWKEQEEAFRDARQPYLLYP